MNQRELLLASLRGEATPRPPVICPGGMMSFAVTDVMRQTGCWWPEAHLDAQAMATLAVAMHEATGFDNVAVPFCMTVEAEALGAEIDYGSADVQPRIVREPLEDISLVGNLRLDAAPQIDRRPVVLEAIRLVRQALPDAAVISAVVGPVSLAGQLLETSLLLRAMHRAPGAAHQLIDLATQATCEFALAQVEAGADVVMVAEPTGTGEILGGKLYREFADPYLRRLIAAVQEKGAPVILHICGCPNTILDALGETSVEAISVDETAHLSRAREALKGQRLMGNVAAFILEAGPDEAIIRAGRKALAAGVNIISPACGVTAATPAEHLRALARQDW